MANRRFYNKLHRNANILFRCKEQHYILAYRVVDVEKNYKTAEKTTFFDLHEQRTLAVMESDQNLMYVVPQDQAGENAKDCLMFEACSVEVDFGLARTTEKPLEISPLSIEQTGCKVTQLEELWDRPLGKKTHDASWTPEVWKMDDGEKRGYLVKGSDGMFVAVEVTSPMDRKIHAWSTSAYNHPWHLNSALRPENSTNYMPK